MIKFSLNKFDEGDLNNFIRLSKSEYPKENPTTNKKKMRWKHLGSTLGPSFIYQMIDNKKTVGRIMYENKILCINRKKYKILNPSDLLIHKKYRSPFSNFLKLINGPANFFDKKILMHTANENSISLYQKLLKLPQPFSLTGYLFPINPFSILKNLFLADCLKPFLYPLIFFIFSPFIIFFTVILKLSSLRFDDSLLKNTEISFLKKYYRKIGTPFFERTEENILWRNSEYSKCNTNSYKIYFNGELVGFFSLLNKKYQEYDCTIILDFMFGPNINFLNKIIIRFYIIFKAISSQSDLIFFMANTRSQTSDVLCGAPFFKLNDNLLPHSTPFFVKQDIINESIFTKTHVTLFDLDYF